MDKGQMYNLAVEAYAAHCEEQGFIFNQPSESASEVDPNDNGAVTLRDSSGEMLFGAAISPEGILAATCELDLEAGTVKINVFEPLEPSE